MDNDLDYSDPSNGLFDEKRTWDLDVDEFLDAAEEVEWLEQELERIEAQLEDRNEIHEKAVSELEWKVDQYTDGLETLYKQHRGKRDGKRDHLKDRIEHFYDELRKERRQHWQDKQRLEEERRAILRELDRAAIDYLVDL